MKKIAKQSIFFLIAVSFVTSGSLNAEPASLKAKAKRAENLQYLMELSVPVANFGTEEQKKELESIKKNYSSALAFFLEENYVESYRGFLETQKAVEKLSEQMSAAYLQRTQEMLGALIQNMLDMDVRYDRNSQFMKMVMKDIDPEVEKRGYDPKEVHYARDKYHIANALKMGYRKLGKAKRVRQAALDLEKWLESGKEMPPRLRKKRIESYLAVIRVCREAKLDAVYAFQLYNMHIEGKSLYEVQKRYAKNPFLLEKRLDPVFDPRIPEEYVLDANDALNRLHKDEVRVKLNGETLSYGKEQNNKKQK